MPWIIALISLLAIVVQPAEYRPLHRLPGGCQLLNAHLVSTTQGVYDLDSGEELLTGVYVQTLSPDGRSVLAEDAVYDLATGEIVLEPGLTTTFYSPDGAYFVVYGDAIYDTRTWERVFDLAEVEGRVLFSPDGAYVVVGDEALYEAESGTFVAEVASGENNENDYVPQFNGDYFIDPAAGVYNLRREEWVFRVDPVDGYGAIHRGGLELAVFNADSTLLYVPRDGVYDTATWERVLTVPSDDGFRAAFSPDGNLLAVDDVGLFEIPTGEQLLGENRYHFSPDGSLLAAYREDFNTVVYEIETLEPRFTVQLTTTPLFSPDGALLLSGVMIDMMTGDVLYTDAPRFGRFSPDSALVVVDFVGVYAAQTGETMLQSVYTLISPDASIVATTEDDACMVWRRQM